MWPDKKTALLSEGMCQKAIQTSGICCGEPVWSLPAPTEEAFSSSNRIGSNEHLFGEPSRQYLLDH